MGPYQPAMWNWGNMHTTGPVGHTVASPITRKREARWESSTPFGRPDEPDVKNTTWGSRSSTSGESAPVTTRSARSAPSATWPR